MAWSLEVASVSGDLWRDKPFLAKCAKSAAQCAMWKFDRHCASAAADIRQQCRQSLVDFYTDPNFTELSDWHFACQGIEFHIECTYVETWEDENLV